MRKKRTLTQEKVILLSGVSKVLSLSKRNIIYVPSTDTYYNVAKINCNNESHTIIVKFKDEYWHECDFNEVLLLLDNLSVEGFKTLSIRF